jgi:hypothetical protein
MVVTSAGTVHAVISHNPTGMYQREIRAYNNITDASFNRLAIVCKKNAVRENKTENYSEIFAKVK